jgi:hypothetical protein
MENPGVITYFSNRGPEGVFRALGVEEVELLDLDRFAGKVVAKLREFEGIHRRPILLLADSIFTKLKPTTRVYPIAISGWVLEVVQPRGPPE